jgi:hypothetical protein
MKNILHNFYAFRSNPDMEQIWNYLQQKYPISTIHAIKQIFSVPNIDNNFIHLGHPLIIPGKDRTAAYNFVFDKFKSRTMHTKQISYPMQKDWNLSCMFSRLSHSTICPISFFPKNNYC